MEVHINKFNIVLKVSDILEAIKNATDDEMLELKYALQKIAEKSDFMRSHREKFHLKKKKCLVCGKKYDPTGPRQKYCSGECQIHSNYITHEKRHYNKKIKPPEALSPQSEPEVPLEENNVKFEMKSKVTEPRDWESRPAKAHIIQVHEPGHITGKPYRTAEDNPFN